MSSCACETPKQAIYGKTELKNGQTHKWLLFIEGALSRENAEAEAIRVQCAWWKGCVVRCWTVGENADA